MTVELLTIGNNQNESEVMCWNAASRFEYKLMMSKPTAYQVVNFVQKRF